MCDGERDDSAPSRRSTPVTFDDHQTNDNHRSAAETALRDHDRRLRQSVLAARMALP
jgi:hypothetical protein